MMPIFFNLESHLWIAYLYFLNGALLTIVLCRCSTGFRELMQTFEAFIVSAFAISIALNGVVLVVLSRLSLSWSQGLYFCGIITAILAPWAICFLFSRGSTDKLISFDRLALVRALFYALIWVVLFFNGALIEQLSDAWWHMAVAFRMLTEGSVRVESAPLNGVFLRSYPPLMHMNLALTSTVSRQPLPVLWNSLTAWMAVVKVMAFYLFAYGLSGRKLFSFFSSFLFVLLPGMGISYLRVSAWPSHAAYILLFSGIYLVFFLQDRVTSTQLSKSFFRSLIKLRMTIAALCFVLTLIYFTHKLELVWFAISLAVYGITLGLLSPKGTVVQHVEKNAVGFVALGSFTLVSVIGLSIYELFLSPRVTSAGIGLLISYVIPIGFSLIFLILFVISNFWWRLIAIIILVMAAGVIVEYQHLAALFNPSYALPGQGHGELPVLATVFGDQQLILPSWRLQLRGALLWSGVLSVPLSIYMALTGPTRMTLFLAGNALVSTFFCVSPFFYQWLSDVMNYHSSWRIMTLLFTPIIIAEAFSRLLRFTVFEKSDAKDS